MSRTIYILIILIGLSGCGGDPFAAAHRSPGAVVPDSIPPPDRSIALASQMHEPQRLLDQQTIGLHDLMRVADQRNPRIGAARDQVGIASAERWQAELYPNPAVELETEEAGLTDDGSVRGKATVAVVQPIAMGKRRAAAIEAADAEQRAAMFDFEQTRLTILGEVRQTFVELVSGRQAIELNDELLVMAHQARQIARQRFDAQAAPESEAIKAEIEAARLELQQKALRRQIEIGIARLQALLGGTPVDIVRLERRMPDEMKPVDVQKLKATMVREHPRVLAAEARVDAARRRVDEARATPLSRIGVRLGYTRDYGEDDDLATAGLSVPLPLFDRGQAAVLRARYDVAKSVKHAAAARNELIEALEVEHSRYLQALEQIDEHRRRIVEPAQRAWEQAQAGYRAGKTSFLDLIDSQRTLILARSTQLSLTRDAQSAHASIWSLVGPALKNDSENTPDSDGEP